MKLLLDTHIWLWALLEPNRLGRELVALMEDATTELWLSPASVWEALLLAERGRIDVAGSPVAWMRERLSGMPVRDAAITREVAITSRTLDLGHEDPADRFIAATAVTYELTLATADRKLLDSRHYATLDNV